MWGVHKAPNCRALDFYKRISFKGASSSSSSLTSTETHTLAVGCLLNGILVVVIKCIRLMIWRANILWAKDFMRHTFLCLIRRIKDVYMGWRNVRGSEWTHMQKKEAPGSVRHPWCVFGCSLGLGLLLAIERECGGLVVDREMDISRDWQSGWEKRPGRSSSPCSYLCFCCEFSFISRLLILTCGYIHLPLSCMWPCNIVVVVLLKVNLIRLLPPDSCRRRLHVDSPNWFVSGIIFP